MKRVQFKLGAQELGTRRLRNIRKSWIGACTFVSFAFFVDIVFQTFSPQPWPTPGWSVILAIRVKLSYNTAIVVHTGRCTAMNVLTMKRSARSS